MAFSYMRYPRNQNEMMFSYMREQVIDVWITPLVCNEGETKKGICNATHIVGFKGTFAPVQPSGGFVY